MIVMRSQKITPCFDAPKNSFICMKIDHFIFFNAEIIILTDVVVKMKKGLKIFAKKISKPFYCLELETINQTKAQVCESIYDFSVLPEVFRRVFPYRLRQYWLRRF